MARYGTSLNIGEDLEVEKAAEEAKKKQDEADVTPPPKEDKPKPKPLDNAPLPIEVGDDWKYLVGALIAMILIVGLGWWALHPSAPAQNSADTQDVATAADVDATISQLLGEKLADPQNKAVQNETISEPANPSNHDNSTA